MRAYEVEDRQLVPKGMKLFIEAKTMKMAMLLELTLVTSPKPFIGFRNEQAAAKAVLSKPDFFRTGLRSLRAGAFAPLVWKDDPIGGDDLTFSGA